MGEFPDGESLDGERDKRDQMLFKDLIDFCKSDAAAQDTLVTVVEDVVDWECTLNDAELTGRPSRVTVFHGQRPPNISVRAYIERVRTFSGCSPCCFILGLYYLEQLKNLDPAYKLNSFNLHRLLITAVMVATKFVDDFYFSNNYWSKVGGIPNSELNGLELEFLFLTNFNLHIKRDGYDKFVQELKNRQTHIHEVQAAQKMGMLTVSPRDNLQNSAMPATMPVR
mmetsp:Transcript_43669/g.68382  ORF Transcript_43669/g.68382 Transcript_43669/m.68382 type:complete len:225 (-) Transcript_43669:133-807(-)|eukprot:CAMPEP_0184292226 /NCGR_PEP_ID=MMETSP1049-20130417/4053_1 /TAXON_ID=77928 /ORGANISM="Proteomonas sulcata, Strain CCMP704" /LENGTH=224 /DNA_ID=CAMNT_0026599931 /DNA_START=501 /DNA_END=1175 /DNA_ORIENTATION=-